tara:strand:+ start:117110 stop:117400 length:291 start_codon:yes stop_codon:yes gene_type:complete
LLETVFQGLRIHGFPGKGVNLRQAVFVHGQCPAQVSHQFIVVHMGFPVNLGGEITSLPVQSKCQGTALVQMEEVICCDSGTMVLFGARVGLRCPNL